VVADTKFTLDIAHNLGGIESVLHAAAEESEEERWALIAFSKNAKWRDCLSRILQSQLFSRIFAVGYSRGQPVHPDLAAKESLGTVMSYLSFVDAVSEVLGSRVRSCYVFGSPLICADFERVVQMLGHVGSVSDEDLDPLQPWMNSFW
jgi:folylpolyglutamate synthase/dihydropteroate synthase